MGQPGYWIFNIANVITLFGMAMGTMVRSFLSISHFQIVMTDFLDSLPIPTSHPTLKRAILQFIITVICLILCILKDPRYPFFPFSLAQSPRGRFLVRSDRAGGEFVDPFLLRRRRLRLQVRVFLLVPSARSRAQQSRRLHQLARLLSHVSLPSGSDSRGDAW